MRARAIAVLCASTWLACSLPACGGDDDGDDTAGMPDAATGPSLATICDVDNGLLVRLFETLFECRPELELLLGAPPPTGAELAALCAGAFQPFLNDGTILLGEESAFTACEAYVAALTCADVELDIPSPCDDLLVGTIALGNPCDADEQCAGQAHCAGGGGQAMLTRGLSVCGVCTAKQGNGGSCQSGAECLGGNCAGASDTSPGTCADFGDVGDQCGESTDCLGERVCDRDSSQCKNEPVWSAGTSCLTFPFDCDGLTGNLFCHPGTGQCTTWLDLGDQCDPNLGQAPSFCRLLEYQTCQDDGSGTFRCTAPTTVGEGQNCGFFLGAECGAGLRCEDDICKPVVALDGDCTGANAVCAAFLSCTNGTCSYGEYTGMCPATL